MRGAFVRGLVEIARRDDRVMLLTADLGFMALEPFSEAYPDRYLNVGVAEQDMVGIACGLAEAGFLPFCYSIATFASMRGYEFIRNAAVLHRLPVRMVGVGGGFEYGPAGGSHHGLEDVALMRVQPGITVIAPADYRQTLAALDATWNLHGPVYYRIGKDDRREVPGLDGRFELGRVEVLGSGDHLLLLASGSVATEVAAAAEKLAALGVSCTMGIVSTLNPAPTESLGRLLRDFPVAITVEAHSINGGLGSLVSEVIAENRIACQAVRVGVSGHASGVTGSEHYLLKRHGLDRDSLTAKALDVLAGTFA
ncbi:MAG TPA: transketolase C-terminal domain-containing protein [Candidatus Dormibacteraeota bacterium]|nr:transketolase C-terminal domain-containing protein [Candidatus Dormibacteraeota bacterium]